MPRKDAYGGPISAQAQQDLVSEGIENFELPKSLVMKIAKSSIPDNVKLQKETVLSLVKGSTVFINYLAATAHDVAQSRQHKSISASDVLKALEIMQFADITGKLQNELAVYRESGKNAESSKSGKKSASSSSSTKKANAATSSTPASAPVKGKGKEKATSVNALPPPFTSAPLPMGGAIASEHVADRPHGEAESISAHGAVEGDGDAMDVDRWSTIQQDDVGMGGAAELEEEDVDEAVGDAEHPPVTT